MDETLHKFFISSPISRGKNQAGPHQLFRDTAREMYIRIISLDADIHDILDDYYTTLSEANEAAGNRQYIDLDPLHLLYLFEYYKIIKIGGVNSSYACMQWPGIHIPQAIINLLHTKGLLVNFIDDNGEIAEHLLQFYERNPTGQGLEFDASSDDKPDFNRYAVELRCQNPITDTEKTPLPSLAELAEATKILLVTGLRPDKVPRKDLLHLLQTASSQAE